MRHIALVLSFISTCYSQVDLSERSKNFNTELLYHTQLEKEGHLVISPFGIWTLMTCIALGASGNSYNQLSKAFDLPKEQGTLVKGYKDLSSVVLRTNNDVSLTSNNFVFLDNRFAIDPTYRDTIQNDFGASLQVLDFHEPSSVGVANQLIEKSGAKVKDVLHSDDFRDSTMILLNVISFKGLWQTPFNKTDTLLEPFYDEDRNVIGNVNMMFHSGKFAFSNIKSLKSSALELPYGTDGKYSMLVILPDPTAKIADVYENFAEMRLKDILKQLKDDVGDYEMEDVDVKLPRFHVSTSLALNKPLKNMGVSDIFQPDLANFQRVTKDSIFVSTIVHVADIEVTESGTVASAVTTATFSNRISTLSFYAARPFLYFIMEKTTATVLFSGAYTKPNEY